MKGPSFIALHKLFDEINEEVEDYVDLLAERVVQLGGVAEGTARIVASRSGLADYPVSISSGGSTSGRCRMPWPSSAGRRGSASKR